MNAWQNGGTAGLTSQNGYFSYWTTGASGYTWTNDDGNKETVIAELINHKEKITSSDWYGPGGKGNWFFGTGATLSGFAGVIQSENMYTQGIRRGLSGNYQLTGRNLSLFGKAAMTKATVPISKIGRMGKVLGTGSFFLGVAFDGVGVKNHYENPNSPNAVHPGKAGFNTVMGFIGWKGGIPGAIISTVYFGVDNFYPGGWVGASETATRTEVYEQHMTGHPFFNNSAIKF